MQNLIRINKRLIPVEQVALIEPYTADPKKPLNTSKQFQSRIVLLDKDSVLSEDFVTSLAQAHGFRMIAPDGAATNGEVAYWVEHFEADDVFKPEKPYQSRLLWREQSGLAHSRLLLADALSVLAIAVRGLPDPTPGESQMPPPRRGRTTSRRGRTQPAREPA